MLIKSLRYCACFLTLLISHEGFAEMAPKLKDVQSAKKTDLKNVEFTIIEKNRDTRFKVHYSQDLSSLVKEIKSFANDFVPKVNDYFGYAPRSTVEVVFENEKRFSNGFAHTFPYNKISLRIAQPLGPSYLASSVNYYKKLFLHEYVHILHLDRLEGAWIYGENIFGSIVKVAPQIVPRWFSEGLAMWAEDHFSEEGRLKNELLLEDVKSFVKNSDCQTLTCLDEPGEYPGGSAAYWVGGAFLKYVENSRPNTLSCIVKRNAEYPIITGSFRHCYGEPIEQAYDSFKRSLNYSAKSSNDENIDFQKGIVLSKQYLIYVTSDKNRSYLTRLDTQSNEVMKEELFKPVLYLYKNLGGVYVKTKSSLGDNADIETYSLNTTDLKLSFIEGDNARYSLSQVKVNFDRAWSFKDESGEIFKLDDFATLMSPEFVDDHIVFLSSNGQNVKIVDIDLLKHTKSEKYFNLPYQYIGRCGSDLYYKRNDQYLKYTNGNLERVKYKRAGKLNYLLEDESRYVTLGADFNFYDGSCGDLFKSEGPYKSRVSDKKQDVKLEPLDYSSTYRLYPKYWFFVSSVTEDDLTYVSFFTSFEDPKKINTFNISLDYYDEDSDVGGNFTYLRDLGGFEVGLTFAKSFSKSSFSATNNYETNYLISLQKEFELDNSLFLARGFAAKAESKTAFSEDNLDKVGLNVLYGIYPFERFSLFSGFQAMAGVSVNMPEDGEDYNRYQLTSRYKMDLYRENFLTLYGSYEKLDKDTFSDGLIYGGGTVKSIHQTYGVAYSDILGNEIWSLKASYDASIWQMNLGWGLVPIYFKDLSLLMGFDYIGADFIYLDNSLLRNKNMTSKNIGLKIDATAFYRAPFSIEMVYSAAEVGKRSEDGFQFILRSAYTY